MEKLHVNVERLLWTNNVGQYSEIWNIENAYWKLQANSCGVNYTWIIQEWNSYIPAPPDMPFVLLVQMADNFK